jgi:rare lipoprotein A
MTRSFLPAAAALAIAASFTLPAHALPQCGSASWYSLPGNRTASGERMDPAAMTAAHRSLPFGSTIRVTNQRNGRAVVVRINDRGPFIRGRVIDVSKAAAQALGFVSRGVASICLDNHG